MDNAATTRVLPEAAQTALELMTGRYGNPESLHDFGLEAEHAVTRARQQIAMAAGIDPEELYFAPSATAANNTFLRGAVRAKRGGRIITTAFEHPAAEEVFKDLEKTFEVVRLIPERGVISPEAFRQALSPDTVLISCMQVNNETGAVTPLREMAAILKRSGVAAPFHTDAVQGFLKEDFRYSAVDAATFAGHKVHAPKGIGALYLRKGLRVAPLILGGGQEKNLFSGTHNVPAIGAWGTACELLFPRKNEIRAKVEQINRQMRDGLEALGAVILSPVGASPFVLSAAFPGYLGENLLHALSEKEIYVSTGSACSARKPSRTLSAVGMEQYSRFALRFSFSDDNTPDEVPAVLCALKEALETVCPVKG